MPESPEMELDFGGGKQLRLVIGDITCVPADVIVNAANSALAGGGGVDGAIHRVGGPSIMRELDEMRPRVGRCPAGRAVPTGAGALPARWVFHTVGPIWRGGSHDEPELLASCYRTCLEMAEERGAAVVSFPSISTGAYGYPLDDAAEIAVETICRHLGRAETTLKEVILVLWDRSAYQAHTEALGRFRRSGLE
jgi:O-acetyl-ADP-ribose deacetylase